VCGGLASSGGFGPALRRLSRHEADSVGPNWPGPPRRDSSACYGRVGSFCGGVLCLHVEGPRPSTGVRRRTFVLRGPLSGMPRPTVSIETVQRMDDLVDDITRVRPSALDTEDKLRILLDEVEDLRDTADQLRGPGPF